MSQHRENSLLSELGGEARLRRIVDDFMDRVFEDMMIGFFFAKADRARIKQKEFELAASHLGGPNDTVKYTGRPLPEAHAAHAITGGHFMRRLQILKETLAAHQVPEHVAAAWLAHNEKLRPAITRDTGSECHTDESALHAALTAAGKPNEKSKGEPG